MNTIAMKKTEELTLLYEITKALSESLDLKRSLYKVLRSFPPPWGWCGHRVFS